MDDIGAGSIIAEEAATSLIAVGERLANTVRAVGWSPDSNIHVNLHNAGFSMTTYEVVSELNFAASRLRELDVIQISPGVGQFLAALTVRAQTLTFDNVGSNLPASVAAALELANAVARRIPLAAPPQVPLPRPEVDWEDLKDRKDLLPRDLARRLRSISDRLDELEPRTTALDDIISAIEQARATAEQLPTDMADLSARRADMKRLSEEATKLAAAIATTSEQTAAAKEAIDTATAATEKRFADTERTASGALERAERALSGATSVGLARAFEQRRKSLARSTLFWTAGLAVALSLGGWIGWERFTALKTILVDGKSASVIWANVLLTIVGIGGPVWFAWLSTKQIGTTFRLSEDYAFKATVSQAYEGYRSEAVLIDDRLRSRLFEAALDRIEEAPIRLVELTDHNTPMQEFMALPSVKKQLDAFPDISGEAIAFIRSKIAAATALAGTAASTAVAAAALAKPGDQEAAKSTEDKKTD